jgi:hypothetical protein
VQAAHAGEGLEDKNIAVTFPCVRIRQSILNLRRTNRASRDVTLWTTGTVWDRTLSLPITSHRKTNETFAEQEPRDEKSQNCGGGRRGWIERKSEPVRSEE